jgi:hypothetical protein
MSASTAPRDEPNPSFAANFSPARRQLASIFSISCEHSTEEMEENQICQLKSTIENSYKTPFDY